MIEVLCPSCWAVTNVDDREAGGRVRCSGCTNPVTVPAKASDTPSGPDEDETQRLRVALRESEKERLRLRAELAAGDRRSPVAPKLVSFGRPEPPPKSIEIPASVGCLLIVFVLFFGMCVVPSWFDPSNRFDSGPSAADPALRRRAVAEVPTRQPEPVPTFAPDTSSGTAPMPSEDGAVHVRGYTRKDGTYVRPHTRRSPSR